MSLEIVYQELIAFHPGSYLMDVLNELDITTGVLAKHLETTEESLIKLLNGEDDLSIETAHKVADFTGVSAQTWLNLQRQYNEKKQEIEKRLV